MVKYRSFLERLSLSAATINLHLSAIRRLADESAESGWLSPAHAIGIRRVKEVKRLGRKMGNWLTGNQAQELVNAASRIELRRAGCRWRVTKPALSVARWVLCRLLQCNGGHKKIRPGGLFLAGECDTITTDQLEKVNASKRSEIAGPLSGTYGLLCVVIGFGKLSRLRWLMVPIFQFLSMNLSIETWSA